MRENRFRNNLFNFRHCFYTIYTTQANMICCNIGNNCYCLLYTSDAADERSSVDLGGRRIIKKTKKKTHKQKKKKQKKTKYETDRVRIDIHLQLCNKMKHTNQ